MPARKILVPYNFSENDQKAIAFVIDSFAKGKDVDITLLHTYVPAPIIKVSDKAVLDRLSGSSAYLDQKQNEREKSLADAAERLVRAGFSKEKVHYIFKARQKEIAQEIIDLAVAGEYDIIVLNHNPGKIRRLFTPSISKKVLKIVTHKEIYIVG